MIGFFGIAFAFAMVACGGGAKGNDSTKDTNKDKANTEKTCDKPCDKPCMNHCQNTCPDADCLAKNCDNCACPEDSPCKQKPACNGENQCCKDKANADCKGDGQCCKDKANGECKHDCENHQK